MTDRGIHDLAHPSQGVAAPGLPKQRRRKIAKLPKELTDSGWFSMLGPVEAHPALRGRVEVDWAVVGGGWFGMHAARRMAELRPQDSIVLLDAGMIGNNAGGRCAGYAIDLAHNPRNPNFAEDEQGNIDERDINLEGVEYLRDGVERHGIQADWSPEGKTHAAASANGEACLQGFAKALDRIGERYSWYSAGEMKELTGSAYYTKGLHTPGTVLLQPAAMLRGVAANLGPNATVFENSPVIEVSYGAPRHVLRTPNGEVHARKLILANNGWLSQFGFYENSAIPVYTYGSMTRPLTEAESARIGGRATYGLIPADSFGTTVRRTADNRLFIRNIYDYCSGFHTTKAQIAQSRESHQMSFDRRFPEISSMGFQYTWGGALSLAQNGGMVFGDLAEGVYGAGFCNGTGVSRGAIFGKALAEYACGLSSRAIDILLRRSRPSRAYPRPVTALGVTASTRYRLWKAGAEV